MQRTTITKTIHSLFGAWLGLTLVLLMLIAPAHCSIAQQARPQTNGIDYVPYMTNPNIYIVGLVVGGGITKDSKGNLYTTVVLQPSDTFALYTQSILLCGNQAGQLNGKTSNPLVLVYRRQSTHKYNGVGCQELESVYELKTEDTLPTLQP